jgi:hypothetical protein
VDSKLSFEAKKLRVRLRVEKHLKNLLFNPYSLIKRIKNQLDFLKRFRIMRRRKD